MKICKTIDDLRATLGRQPCAFVPTMGNLHDGHMALMREAIGQKEKNKVELAVASIFVNRLQFLPSEDFDQYPRTFDPDCAKLEAAGCDIVFAPLEREMYPQAQGFKVHPPPGLANILEGEFRPGFFVGVSTVVMKLFQIVQPSVAVFGKKDYQQLMIIRQMVQQMAMPIQIVGHETARAEDGLALSSRNGFLCPDQRAQAVELLSALKSLIASVRAGERNFRTLEASAIAQLASKGWQPDYLTVRRRSDLSLPDEQCSPWSLVALGAAKLGSTRLIDNLEF